MKWLISYAWCRSWLRCDWLSMYLLLTLCRYKDSSLYCFIFVFTNACRICLHFIFRTWMRHCEEFLISFLWVDILFAYEKKTVCRHSKTKIKTNKQWTLFQPQYLVVNYVKFHFLVCYCDALRIFDLTCFPFEG